MSKDNFFKRSIFIGPKGISVGQSAINHENIFSFKKIGDFGKLLPVMRFRDITEYSFVDLEEYNPKDGDYTGNVWRIFFCDLVDGKKFSFKDSSPTQVMLENVNMKQELLHYQNSFQKLLKLIQASSIDDYQKKMASDIVKEARSLTSYNPGGPIQTNTK